MSYPSEDPWQPLSFPFVQPTRPDETLRTDPLGGLGPHHRVNQESPDIRADIRV